jgi:hypothetical protein
MRARNCSAAAFACLLAGCVAEENYAYNPPAQQTCYRHDPLDYVPVLVKISVTANYELKNWDGLSGENRYFFEELDDINPGKYQLADGVTPNLILTITLTNDGNDHYGAVLEGHGNGEGYLFSYTWAQNYVTARRLREDVADKVNAFITQGWHRGNC